jgi:hypothetical protein
MLGETKLKSFKNNFVMHKIHFCILFYAPISAMHSNSNNSLISKDLVFYTVHEAKIISSTKAFLQVEQSKILALQ